MTNHVTLSSSEDRIQIRLTLALWQWHITVFFFIVEYCTEGKLLTHWAKTLSHGDKFSSLGDMSPSIVVLKDALPLTFNEGKNILQC